eukprot:4103780-Pyramimonas_sp.AAC.1
MDVRVDTLRRTLVVNTLELQMEFVFGALEEEAAEVIEGGSFRDREVELFVAEFGSLDARLAQLTQAVDNDEAIVIDDEYLAVLATEVPGTEYSSYWPTWGNILSGRGPIGWCGGIQYCLLSGRDPIGRRGGNILRAGSHWPVW